MMKLTVCLSATFLTVLASFSGARADTPNDASTENPYANLDPDGVPLAVTHPEQRPVAEDLTTMQQQADQQERERNWLLLDYEDVERKEAKQAADSNASQDIYLQLSQNKELARLAGLTPLDPTPPPPPQPHASPSPDGAGLSLRPEAPQSGGAISPVVSPWSSDAASAATPYFISAYSAPIPADLAPTVTYDSAGNAAPPAPAADTSKPPPLPSPTDTIDLETPGMVAAKTNPDSDTPDLNLDSLPDQNQGDTPTHQPADAPPELPQMARVMDADQLHLAMSARLKAPNPALAKAASLEQKPTETTPQAPPPADEVPMPISQQPQISPVHAPVSNPYDILNR